MLAKMSSSTFHNFLSGSLKDNIYIDMQAGRNLLPKLLVADN